MYDNALMTFGPSWHLPAAVFMRELSQGISRHCSSSTCTSPSIPVLGAAHSGFALGAVTVSSGSVVCACCAGAETVDASISTATAIPVTAAIFGSLSPCPLACAPDGVASAFGPPMISRIDIPAK